MILFQFGESENGKVKLIRKHTELEVYQQAFASAMRIYKLSKSFPKEERYSLTDQARRSSRSVCANLAEAWRKRRYSAAFVAKLNDCEAEAAETLRWMEFAQSCGYIKAETASELNIEYDHITGKLVNMINHPEKWTLK